MNYISAFYKESECVNALAVSQRLRELAQHVRAVCHRFLIYGDYGDCLVILSRYLKCSPRWLPEKFCYLQLLKIQISLSIIFPACTQHNHIGFHLVLLLFSPIIFVGHLLFAYFCGHILNNICLQF